MGRCVKCGATNVEIDFLERCEPCFRHYVMSVEDDGRMPFVKAPGYTVTNAHLDDIRRRRIDENGKVYRDYGKKSFVV